MENDEYLPPKYEFGDQGECKKDSMYHQDFTRLKAVCLNNLASCFFNEGFIDQADKFNDMALTEDPDYARAHYRKCTILAERGDIKRAILVANSAIKSYSNEMETDQSNIKMVPTFQTFIADNENKEEWAEE